jgi:hypothetical protein
MSALELLRSMPQSLMPVLITTIVGVVGYFVKPKVKLIWGQKTNFSHVLRPKKDGDLPVRVSTSHYIVQNSGRASAKDIEIVFNYAPDEVSIWPQRAYKLEKNSEGRLIAKLDFLAPKEFIDVFLLSVANDLPELLNVKNPEFVGKAVNIGHHQIFPKVVYYAMILGMFLGAIFVVEKIQEWLVGY